MARLWTFLTCGNSLLFTKQLLRWGLIRKCIFLHFSFFLGKVWNCQAASETWSWCLKEEQGRTHSSRPGQGDFILSFSIFSIKVILESVFPLNWFVIDDVFWTYSDPRTKFHLIGSWWMNDIQCRSQSQTSHNEGFSPAFFNKALCWMKS